MKRRSIWAVSVVLGAALALIGRGLVAQAASSATTVCGTLIGSATWTTAGSPYVVCSQGATIVSGATIAIQPGVTVQLDTNAQLRVDGALLAPGTAVQP